MNLTAGLTRSDIDLKFSNYSKFQIGMALYPIVHANHQNEIDTLATASCYRSHLH